MPETVHINLSAWFVYINMPVVVMLFAYGLISAVDGNVPVVKVPRI